MSIPQATECALISSLAYKELEDTLLLRSPKAIIIQRENARVVLIEGPDFIDVAFAGSDDYEDWMGNVLRNKVAREGIGKVYKGVADYYSLLRDAIHDSIPDPQKPQRVMGHSLGGACAEMYAARRTIKGKPVKCLHTFGAPMVGNGDFANASARTPEAFNWWIKGDVVPYQPKLGGLIPLGYVRAREPHVVDGLKITRTSPFWTPPVLRWFRKGVAHAAYEGYYEGLKKLEGAVG